jgi:hypothetical protein
VLQLTNRALRSRMEPKTKKRGLDLKEKRLDVLTENGPRKEKKINVADPDSGSEIRDELFQELRINFWEKKYLNSLMGIRDHGWKNSDPVSGINIPEILYFEELGVV